MAAVNPEPIFGVGARRELEEDWVGHANARTVLQLMAVVVTSTTPALGQNESDVALASIDRLEPQAFPALPNDVTTVLETRGCMIPQTYLQEEPHNVIRGHFLSADAQAWAVLCSVSDSSTILVFDEQAPNEPLELAPSADRGWLQGIGGGRIGYSHVLGVAPSEYIAEKYEQYGGDDPLPPLTHDGIEDIFAEKGSVLWYWHDGEWLRLPGAD